MRNNSLKSNVVICGTHVKELNDVKFTGTSIEVGAALTFSSLEHILVAKQKELMMTGMPANFLSIGYNL